MTVTIPAGYCGFPGFALGGYSAGLMAAAAGTPLEVTLRRPIRTETELELHADDGAVRLASDGDVLAEGTPGTPGVEVADRPSMDEAAEATARYPTGEEHLQPACFCCSSARQPGDGLAVHPSPVEGHPRSLVVGRWVPHADFAGQDGTLPVEMVWAALDCPAIWSVYHRTGENTVTGRLSTTVDAPIIAGTPYIVTGWMTGSKGRRRYAAAALRDDDGDVVARSTQTCIAVDEDQFPV